MIIGDWRRRSTRKATKSHLPTIPDFFSMGFQVGPQSARRITASACAHLGTGWTEKQDDSQIDEANKNYLRNTDHFKLITPHLNVNERLRDSPVPWHCRARCQLIGFKAAMALRLCVQRRNLEDSSAARRRFQCGPARPAMFPEGNHSEFSSRVSRKKIRYFSRKNRFRYKHQTDTLKLQWSMKTLEVVGCIYTEVVGCMFTVMYRHMTQYTGIWRHMTVYPFSSR